MHKIVSVLTLLAAAIALPPAAHADTLQFKITSVTDLTFSTITYNLPNNPAPATFVNLNPFEVDLTNITVTYAGGTGGSGVEPNDLISFYNAPQAGGLAVNNPLIYPFGPQIFGGTVTAPTFAPGEFLLSNHGVGDRTDYILDVTALGASSNTPEPSSLVLLGSGALLFAGAARRRFSK